MTLIETADPETATSAPNSLDARRSRRGRGWKLAAAAVGIAAAFVAGLVVAPGTPAVAPKPAAAEVLTQAADAQRDQPGIGGSGTIRHARFINLTDEGAPTYDRYVAADGRLYDTAGGGAPVLQDYPSYPSSSSLQEIPSDAAGARAWMADEVARQGLSSPGEAPVRGLYRLATDLLTDPAVSPEAKAAVLDVIAGFDLDAVRAVNKGPGVDLVGRTGTVLELQFDEGYIDQMIIDPDTGALLAVTTRNRDDQLVGGQVYLAQEMVEAAR